MLSPPSEPWPWVSTREECRKRVRGWDRQLRNENSTTDPSWSPSLCLPLLVGTAFHLSVFCPHLCSPPQYLLSLTSPSRVSVIFVRFSPDSSAPLCLSLFPPTFQTFLLSLLPPPRSFISPFLSLSCLFVSTLSAV